MIPLTNRSSTTSQKLVITLAAAATTTYPTITVGSYIVPPQTKPDFAEYRSAPQLTLLTAETETTIADAPPEGSVKDVNYISVYNADTVSCTATIAIDDNGTNRNLIRATLATLETLYYEDKRGWYSSGTLATTADVAAAVAALIPSGTRMVFQQTSAPSGWTKESAAAYNDAAPRFTTGAVSTGGADAFNTLFGAAKSTASYTLTSTDIPSHLHGVSITSGTVSADHTHSFTTSSDGSHTHTIADGATYGIGVPAGGANYFGAGGNAVNLLTTASAGAHTHSGTTGGISANHTHSVSGNTGNTGGGGGHSHTLSNMNLKFVDCIVAQKN